MTKADKIKICQAFATGKSEYWVFMNLEMRVTAKEIESALRWGLNHLQELRKGK